MLFTLMGCEVQGPFRAADNWVYSQESYLVELPRSDVWFGVKSNGTYWACVLFSNNLRQGTTFQLLAADKNLALLSLHPVSKLILQN